MQNKKDKAPIYMAVGLLVVFIIALLIFLFSKDSYNGQEITGWQTLQIIWPSFYVWCGIGLLLAGVFGYLLYSNYTGSGAIGRKLPGSDGLSWFLLILTFACLCGPWGKACTEKANGGHTLPKVVSTGLFLWSKCEHVYVKVEQPEIKLSNTTNEAFAINLIRYGKQNGPEIVCVKCLDIRTQIYDFGNAPKQLP